MPAFHDEQPGNTDISLALEKAFVFWPIIPPAFRQPHSSSITRSGNWGPCVTVNIIRVNFLEILVRGILALCFFVPCTTLPKLYVPWRREWQEKLASATGREEMPRPRSPEIDAEDDILSALESDTWSTEVYNGSAGSPPEEFLEERSAEALSSPEPSPTPMNNPISARSMNTKLTERAARLETMLEEDGPSLFGIERLRHAPSSSLSIQQDKRKTETSTSFFGKDSKSDELLLEGYARTDLIIFPVRQPVSNGENKPWRVIDGREATQPPRRNRQTAARNPTHSQTPSVNLTPITGQNSLTRPDTSSVGSQYAGNTRLPQTQLTDFYWRQDQRSHLPLTNPPGYYHCETSQLGTNPVNYFRGSEGNMNYTGSSNGGRTSVNTTSTSAGPFRPLQTINLHPRPYPHASFNDRNVQNGAIEGNIPNLPQSAESSEERENNERRHIPIDNANMNIEPYNSYPSNESETPFTGTPFYQQPHPSAAHFHPPTQAFFSPPQENLPSDFHTPMSTQQGVQNEVTTLSTNEVELNNGELQIEAPKPWDMKDLLNIEDSED